MRTGVPVNINCDGETSHCLHCNFEINWSFTASVFFSILVFILCTSKYL